jgi:hypothetical protein
MVTYYLTPKPLVIGGAKPARARKRPSLATELRNAAKAGLKSTAASVDRDGRVTLQFGEPAPASQPDDLDRELEEWRARHAH